MTLNGKNTYRLALAGDTSLGDYELFNYYTTSAINSPGS